MTRIHVLVEGQTEEAFIGRCLKPHLAGLGIFISTTIIVTRLIASGPSRRGGVGSWSQIRRDLRLLNRDSSVAAITTFLDYYGLPTDVPGMSDRPDSADNLLKVRHVETAIDRAFPGGRVRSFLALHEFEALLYSDPEVCGDYLSSKPLKAMMIKALDDAGGTPEDINDGPSTAPSRRIVDAYPEYQKAVHGPTLAERIGLDHLRAECGHFAEWLDWLESYSK